MKVRVVKVMKGRTVNLGNSNFVRFEYGVEVDLDEGDNYKEVFDRFDKEVEDKVATEHGNWWNS